MLIQLRTGFCDPEGELLRVLDRPGWRRLSRRRKAEVVDELVQVCEDRGLWEAEAWLPRPGSDPRHIIGYWHPPNIPRGAHR
jgi:hypothetical protein